MKKFLCVLFGIIMIVVPVYSMGAGVYMREAGGTNYFRVLTSPEYLLLVLRFLGLGICVTSFFAMIVFGLCLISWALE